MCLFRNKKSTNYLRTCYLDHGNQYLNKIPLEAVQYRSVIFSELHSAYNEESPSQRTICRWYNELKKGRLSVIDEVKSHSKSMEKYPNILKK